MESTKFPTLGRRLFFRGTIAGLFLSLAFLRLMHSSYSNTRMFTIPNIIISKIPNRTELNHTNNVSGKTKSRYYLPTSDSSLSYSWVDNQWQPPPGVPLYTIQEMRRIFTQGNVLWIGDSTARQDYVTLYNMITSSSSTNDGDHYYSNLTVAQLNEGINVNKGGKITEICDRRYPFDLLLCRNIGNATVDKIVHYDYTEQICFREVFNYINTNWRLLMARYSTILVSVGIWDVIRFQYCGSQNATYVRDVLNVIDEKFSANGHVQLLWKVHCGAGNENASEMDRTGLIQQLTRDWFATHPPPKHSYNVVMIDLAKEMEGRTYGEARIAGDIPPHLGPTARMLFLQMATHAIAQQRGGP